MSGARILHTADWHVGKTLKGVGRLNEQQDVLGEIIGLVREHEVDVVLVPGDLYGSAAPQQPGAGSRPGRACRCTIGFGCTREFLTHVRGLHEQAVASEFSVGRAITGKERAHARVEDRIRCAKDTGLDHFPSRSFAINQAWLTVVMLATDLIVWTSTCR